MEQKTKKYDYPISVLMPAYNAEKYISESIESILSQTFTDFEFIIIDDGSTDGTWGVIQKYAAKEKRIKVFKNEKNSGNIFTRNRLIGLAKGKYFVWQDADDISLSYRLAHQYDFMEKNPEVGICGGWLEFFNVGSKTSLRKYGASDSEVRKKIFRYSPVAQPAAIVRKDIMDTVGTFDPCSVVEDLDMSFRIGRISKFANLQEIVVRYREYGGGATIRRLRMIDLKTIATRLRYLDNNIYQMTTIDHLYGILQYLACLFTPPRFRIFLFNFFRNN